MGKRYSIRPNHSVPKNDTFIEQVVTKITTDKSNESIHLELSTPTYARGPSS
jgi:hypothetical protein